MAWCEKSARVTSPEWMRAKRWLLRWWMENLAGVNLRALPEDESVAPGLKPSPHGCDLGSHIIYALDRKDPKTGKAAGTRGKRIAEIKSFYGWLRTEKFLLRAHEDPTFGRLKGIKSKRAQTEGYSKVIPYEHIQKVQKHWYSTPLVTNQHGANDPHGNEWKAEVLELQLGTAWHYSEVRRFCDPAEVASAIIAPGSRCMVPFGRLPSERAACSV